MINFHHNLQKLSAYFIFKMSIIGKKLGNAKKHNGQILEHNRLRPTGEQLAIAQNLIHLIISASVYKITHTYLSRRGKN